MAAQFTWERDFERPWDAVEEGADGRLLDAGGRSRNAGGAVGPRGAPAPAALQRGLLRQVLLVVDASAAGAETDLRPSRAAACEAAARAFVRAFFDANPISSLGVIVARGGVAEKAIALTANPASVAKALRDLLGSPPRCEGAFSFENVLTLATRMLSLQPPVATREVIVLHSALASCDPGDVFAALDGAVDKGVRVSVASLAGEVFLASRVAAATGGAYSVPCDYAALLGAVLAHCTPPPRREAEAAAAARVGLMRVGFPARETEVEALCACHAMLRSTTYACPRCAARVCDVPSNCAVCDLRLISASTLARSYHHIFPVPRFEPAAPAAGEACATCLEALDAGGAFACGACGVRVCATCNATVHDALHTCPGCV